MKRLLVLGAVLAALACAPNALAYGNDPYCPSGRVVAQVYQTVKNDVDRGRAGNAWAQTTYTRKIVVTEVAPLTYCAAANTLNGSFTTFAGISPNATGRVRAGRTGSMIFRWRSTIFTGVFAPKVATSGYLGTFDYGCDQSFVCPGFVDWRDLFFGATAGYEPFSYSYGFGSEYQAFIRRDFGTWGDITG